MKKFIIIISLLFYCSFGFSQTYSTQNKKAIAAYEEAIKNFELRNYNQAETFLKLALKFDNTFSEAYYLLGGVYAMNNDTQQLLSTLTLAVTNCAEKTPWVYYKLAYEQYDNGLYEDAFKNLQILQQKKLNPQESISFQELFTACKNAIDLKSKPVNFNPTNMGSAINTIYDDFHPAITVDEETFIITSNIPLNQMNKQEDMFYSYKNGTIWSQRQVFPKPITTLSNEGAQSISADGRTMIFTACGMAGGMGSCDIYISYKVGNQWLKPKNIGAPINTKNWETQPSLSADGRTLFFVSNRPGGYGKKDIWVSTLSDTNTWSKPINLGPQINTKDEEESPFIHADGTTLYFSSDGHMGMGKKDLFATTKLTDSTWSTPKNLGYPLNTQDNESHIIINAEGTKGYFASNRYGSTGGIDIYEFNIDKSFPVRPNPVTYIKGVVFDAKNIDKKLPAFIDLSDVITGEIFYEHIADNYTGEFIVPFAENQMYALSISYPGYLFYSENVNLAKVKKQLSIPLQPIQVGNTVVLNNVFFDTDSYELKPESKVELLTIVSFLKNNPNVCFEIGGHTDNTGNKQHNITLSENRAKAVFTYLTNNGVVASRLTYKGYADTKPVVENTTPENKAKNRRTEMVVTKI